MSGLESVGITGDSADQVHVAQADGDGAVNDQLFTGAYAQSIKVAEAGTETITVRSDAGAETAEEPFLKQSDKIQVGVNDPLKSFWKFAEINPVRKIDDVKNNDDSWRPIYEELVQSDGYQAIQDYRNAAEGLENHLQLMHPDSRDEIMANVITYLKGEDGAEQQLNDTDPALKGYADRIKTAMSNPEFGKARHVARFMTPAVAQSMHYRESLAADLIKHDNLRLSLLVMQDVSQMRNFLETTTINQGFKMIVNDSSTRA